MCSYDVFPAVVGQFEYTCKRVHMHDVYTSLGMMK